MISMQRREFVGKGFAGALCGIISSSSVWAELVKHELTGAALPKWQKGHFRITTFFTGTSESTYLIFPDGTSMLIDLGDYVSDSIGLYLPSKEASAGEVVSRYILSENPFGKKVDYFLLTHYHSDHAGAVAGDRRKGPLPRAANGRYTCRGIGAAIDMLDFGVMIDRSWPNMNDPAPRGDGFDMYTVRHIREIYTEVAKRGVKVERFELSKNSQQIRLMHDSSAAKAPFSVHPHCARGEMVKRDGSVVSLASFVKGARRDKFDENPLSTGLTIRLGDFGYFNAGDFSGFVKGEGGLRVPIESLLAPELDSVEVMKASHHACNDGMPQSICSALSPRVLVCGVWDIHHLHKDVLPRLLNTSRPCLLAPGFFPVVRQKAEKDSPWFKAMAPETFKGCHSVIDVAPDGKTYRLMMVSAADDRKTVLGAYDFKTRAKANRAG